MTAAEFPSLHRRDLPRLTVACLQAGRPRKPDVLLVRQGDHDVIVKDFAPRGWLVRHTLGRWAIAREVRAYRALRGHPAVPVFLGRIDALAFAVEYRPGEHMRRRLAETLPKEFIDELEDAVAHMHEAGVVHLDLRHRSNVLADGDGHPLLLDFASAVLLRPDGWLGRWLLPWLRSIDRRAVQKWRARLQPNLF